MHVPCQRRCNTVANNGKESFFSTFLKIYICNNVELYFYVHILELRCSRCVAHIYSDEILSESE
jgi:hypothetical protein